MMRMRRLALGSYDEEVPTSLAIARAIWATVTTMYETVRRGMKTTSMPGMSPALRQAFRIAHSLRHTTAVRVGSSDATMAWARYSAAIRELGRKYGRRF